MPTCTNAILLRLRGVKQGRNILYRFLLKKEYEIDDNHITIEYTVIESNENYIYKIDDQDNVTVAFTSTGGASLRAACIVNDELYFGGVDSREEIAAGDEGSAKLAILKKSNTDDTEWTRIADYKDFGEYAKDPALTSSAASPIWDICVYNGYIYATIPGSNGVIMYKGHPASSGEQANEYGWYWTEIVGKHNGINNPGLAATSAGRTGAEAGMVVACTTPFVFKNKLYMIDFDNTIQAELMALSGIVLSIAGDEAKASEYLLPMYTTLNNPQKLWCYDDSTGKFNEVTSFTKLMENTSNEYLWQGKVYNDELYISTMDSAVLYDWVLQLTGDEFTTLTNDQINNIIGSLDKLDNLLDTYGAGNSELGEMKQGLSKTKEYFVKFKEVRDDEEEFKKLNIEYENVIVQGQELLNQLFNTSDGSQILSLLKMVDSSIEPNMRLLYENVDLKGIEMYTYITKIVTRDVEGFDLFKTSDGINFERITNDGFSDKYNYGGRTLLPTKNAFKGN